MPSSVLMDALQREVEALSAEVTRLRLLVRAVSQSTEPSQQSAVCTATVAAVDKVPKEQAQCSNEMLQLLKQLVGELKVGGTAVGRTAEAANDLPRKSKSAKLKAKSHGSGRRNDTKSIPEVNCVEKTRKVPAHALECPHSDDDNDSIECGKTPTKDVSFLSKGVGSTPCPTPSKSTGLDKSRVEQKPYTPMSTPGVRQASPSVSGCLLGSNSDWVPVSCTPSDTLDVGAQSVSVASPLPPKGEKGAVTMRSALSDGHNEGSVRGKQFVQIDVGGPQPQRRRPLLARLRDDSDDSVEMGKNEAASGQGNRAEARAQPNRLQGSSAKSYSSLRLGDGVGALSEASATAESAACDFSNRFEFERSDSFGPDGIARGSIRRMGDSSIRTLSRSGVHSQSR
ncbi:hypothetical protein TRVL_03905 [Trypanosoma vivax]|nr:hypothetical protein TRVL_03905 [Trypanosoma vivax]